jgi:LacI family transcriptional regulator
LYYNQIQNFAKRLFMRKRRVTVEDVARAAGVSLMTVSRAINDREGIGEETRARILTLSQQMGYQPSRIARSLAARQTATLGLVIPDVSNPFFAHIARGAEDAAYENGYNVFLLNSAEDPARERSALDSLWQQEVDGVILCSSRLPQDDLQVYFERFPQMVLVNRELESSQPTVATINVDDRAGAEAAVRYLLESGRERIVFIAGPETSVSGQRRLEGYKAGLAAFSRSFDANWVEHCPPTTQGGLEAALRLLERHPEMGAILAFNDLVAVGALQACKAGWKIVPTETAVIGADDIPLASLVQPMLTTLRVNQYEIGRSAIALLLEMFAKSPARAINLQPELVLRGSG